MSSGKIEIPFGQQNLILETGKIAKQANAAVTATLGGTTVLVATCMNTKVRDDIDFFPLMVEYQEKAYAAGKIPGGFLKREGRPSQKETLTARIIDRPIRPLFPEGFFNEVVVTCNVISSDGENDPDVVAMLGASAALTISDIPFNGPVGTVRLAYVNGEFVANPTYEQRAESTFDLFVVGQESGITMIEGEGLQAPEDLVSQGLEKALEYIKPQIEAQRQYREQVGKEKVEPTIILPDPAFKAKVAELSKDKLAQVYSIADKQEREVARQALIEELTGDLTPYAEFTVNGNEITGNNVFYAFDLVEYEHVRDSIFNENKRADGRKTDELRALDSEIDFLPRTHGSAVFTRGQTQSLAVLTLGTKRDEKMEEGLTGIQYQNFMLHYNFPPFSVGEARGSRAPGRREIGHGALAGKALAGILPERDDFPYTIRVVSEILESNGSSSMASVCAGCLSLMAGGVPIKNPVAGISIGLVMKDDGDYRLLTDIMGLEDHHGDMDFKIAGSEKGITAIQLDIKVNGIPVNILIEGIKQAREARLKILENMLGTINGPKENLAPLAPRIMTTQVPQEKIGDVIGPGGKTIKKIMETTGAESIDIDDEGKVVVFAQSQEAAEAAKEYIAKLVEVPEVGKVYEATVQRVESYGAFCEFLPGRSGLVHVSEFSEEFVKDLSGVVNVGDRFPVKLFEIDNQRRYNLSKKRVEQN